MNDLVKIEKPNALTLKTDDRGNVVTNTIGEQVAHAEMMISSGLLPKSYQRSSQVITAMQYAGELGLPRGIVSLRQIAVINGTPSIYGDLPMSIVYNSGKLKAIEEFVFDKQFKEICFANKNLNADVYGACCRVMREGDSKYHEAYFTMDDARQAGLTGNVWNKYKKDMLKYRARSRALKDRFPDILNGVSIAEFDYGVLPNQNASEFTVDLEAPAESSLNDRFSDKDIEQGAPVEIEMKEGEVPADVEIPEDAEAEVVDNKEDVSETEKNMIEEMEKIKEEKRVTEKKKEESNVDWDKVSPEIKEEIKKKKEEVLGKETIEEIPWDDVGPGDYVFPSGSYEGKKIKEIPKKKLEEYHEKLRKHIAKHPNAQECRDVYLAITEFWATKGVK